MRNQQHRSGQSLVEFTLLIPLLLLLVMGLFDLGRAVFYFAVLNTAVRESTRVAIVQPGCDYTADPDLCTGDYLDDIALSNCDNASSSANKLVCEEIIKKNYNIGELSSITITINHFNNSTDDPVINISINFLFTAITPGISSLIGDIPINVESQMLLTPIAKP